MSLRLLMQQTRTLRAPVYFIPHLTVSTQPAAATLIVHSSKNGSKTLLVHNSKDFSDRFYRASA